MHFGPAGNPTLADPLFLENAMIIAKQNPTIVMDIVTDPGEVARARARRELFDRNLDWFQAHALEIGDSCRGKFICIAGQQLFAAETAEEVLSLATAAHPEDEGRFIHYIPRERLVRIYANQRPLAPLP
jgi:hypothetical protein